MIEPLLIVGASGRAAAWFFRRRGFEPIVIDLFADADTRQLANTFRCDPADYPHGFIPLAEKIPPTPWLYTGGLENHPDVVAAISQRHPLVGNGPEVLAKVRDPFWLADTLPTGRYAPVSPTCPAISPSAVWLRKPRRGAGGFGIHIAKPDEPPSADHYFQRFFSGSSFSAVFETDATGTRLLGVFQQLTGIPWLHAKPWRYSGNIGPVPAEKSVDELTATAERLVSAAGLLGIWGFDFILTHDAGPVVVEVNPRFPASAELVLSPGAKAIYFAPHRLQMPDTGAWELSVSQCRDRKFKPTFGDVSLAGTVVEAGDPVLTVLAPGGTAKMLHKRVTELDRLFAACRVED